MALRWWLLASFLAWALLMGIDPASRSNWWFGNIPTLVFLGPLVWTMAKRPLGNASYVLALLFLALHEYGTHYGYQVPWLDGGRNHYDRIVHAAFGGLLVWPMRDLLQRTGAATGAWSWLLAVALMLAAAVLYEIMEWAGALMFYDGPPEHFLGHQGDALDATKDMGLSFAASIVGAVVGVVVGDRGRGAKGKDGASMPRGTREGELSRA